METLSCQFDPHEILGVVLPDGDVIAMDSVSDKKLLAFVAAMKAANEPHVKVAS